MSINASEQSGHSPKPNKFEVFRKENEAIIEAVMEGIGFVSQVPIIGEAFFSEEVGFNVFIDPTEDPKPIPKPITVFPKYLQKNSSGRLEFGLTIGRKPTEPSLGRVNFLGKFREEISETDIMQMLAVRETGGIFLSWLIGKYLQNGIDITEAWEQIIDPFKAFESRDATKKLAEMILDILDGIEDETIQETIRNKTANFASQKVMNNVKVMELKKRPNGSSLTIPPTEIFKDAFFLAVVEYNKRNSN